MTIDHILVSVIMPVYNAAPYLAESIESILSQSHQNFELIIIDDGSTDNSKAVIEKYTTDKRVKFIEKKCNTGKSDALNIAIAQAKGRYLVGMDADDKSVNHRLATQVRFMEEHPKVGVAGSYLQEFEMVDEQTVWRKSALFPLSNNQCRLHLYTHQPFGYHPTIIMRHEIIKNHQLHYDVNLVVSEDNDLWHRMLPYCEFRNIPEVLVFYRVHSTQLSATYKHLMTPLYLESLKRALRHIIPDISDVEFDLHCSFFTQKHSVYSNNLLRDTLQWLEKLLVINKEQECICAHDYLQQHIAKKWFILCNRCSYLGYNTWTLYKSASFGHMYSIGKKNQALFFIDCLFSLKSHYLK